MSRNAPRTQASLIYNPLAGALKHHDPMPAILAQIQSAGWDVKVQTTRLFSEIEPLAAAAREQGQDVVIVVGGDGSLNAAVNGLANSQVALGVIPSGTGNVWARQIGLPVPTIWNRSALVESAREMAAGFTHTIDLGKAAGRYFLLWAGAGLDAEIAATIEPKPAYVRRFGLAGYALYVLLVGLRYRGVQMSIQIDGQPFEGRVVLMVASNAYLYAAMRLAPQTRLDDGLLDMFIFPGRGALDLLYHAMYLLAGRVNQDRRAIIMPGRSMSIQTREKCPIHLDAEPFTHTPVTIEVVPQALRVILPRQVPRSLIISGTGAGG